MFLKRFWVAGAAVLFAVSGSLSASAGDLGVFKHSGDVGEVGTPGSVEYDKDAKTYTVTASGHNMWAERDGFHFVWKKMKAKDLSILSIASWKWTWIVIRATKSM